MTDITLQLDDVLVERLHKLAQAHGCTVDALVAQWLHEQRLPDSGTPEAEDVTAADWNSEEAAFLRETMGALDEVPASTPLAATDATEWDKPGT